jgi:type I restriction enzyme S subunit
MRLGTYHVKLDSVLVYSLNSERVRRYWKAICNTSSGLNTINRRQLRRLEILKPPRPEQEEIIELIEASKATIRSCEGKISALTALKKSLLQNLLTGKVRVRMGAQG